MNVDGQIRKRGGPELAAACLALPTIETPHETAPRDIQRWESTAKKGKSLHLRCPAGSAIATAAYGALVENTSHVIHAVAPDAEYGYEGHYQGTPGARGGAGGVKQKSAPPLRLLRNAFASALRVAAFDLGARKVSVAALGCGVKGWRPAISAAVALDASVELAAAMAAAAPPRGDRRGDCGDTATTFPPPLREIEFVLGADDAWVAWTRVARQLLSEHDEEDDDDAARVGEADAAARRSGLEPPRGATAAPAKEPPAPLAWTLRIPTATTTAAVATRGARDVCGAGFDAHTRLEHVDELAYFLRPAAPNDGYAGEHWRPTQNGW